MTGGEYGISQYKGRESVCGSRVWWLQPGFIWVNVETHMEENTQPVNGPGEHGYRVPGPTSFYPYGPIIYPSELTHVGRKTETPSCVQ